MNANPMYTNIDLRVYGFCCACEYGSQDINQEPCKSCKHITETGINDNWKERTDI